MRTVLPTPPTEPADAVRWVSEHLGDLVDGPVTASARFRGGQAAADAALAALDVTGYARRRSVVWPPSARGATGLSPYIRHGLLSLPEVDAAVRGGPGGDVAKLRDELAWQEYARHLYARLGTALAEPLRADPPPPRDARVDQAWDPAMACMDAVTDELERDGWAVNQTRMWLASQWSVRHGLHWRDGEDRLYRTLVDGSRAANRLGWQWTVGTATGRRYGFSRWQVERRAPALCRRCPLRDACPIEDWPDAEQDAPRRTPDPRLRRDPHPDATAGPRVPAVSREPNVVWLTAESLGDRDPALVAHPHLPTVFVFDAPLLARLRLRGLRLVFLAETLADLATRRAVEVHRGNPVEVLGGRAVATTFAPVPGWRRRAADIDLAALHPWPWLRRPAGEPLTSFTAWRRARR